MSEGPFRSPHLVARAAKPNDHIPVLVQRIGSWRLSIEREPLSAEALRRRYGARAGSYSQRLRRLGYTEAYAKLAQRLAGPAPDALAAGARVLDCGVGSGALSLAVASAASGPLRHHLLDISPTMLQVARDALASRGVRSEAVPADLRSIPYPDARFDVVMAAHAIEHLADPIEALREMHRVTRPGGCALVVVTRRSPFGRLIHLLPGVSVAAVALAHGLNANLVRRWLNGRGVGGVSAVVLKAAPPVQQSRGAAVGTFLPVQLDHRPPATDIRLELRRGSSVALVTWPVHDGAACGAWLREWLG